uniref:Fibronectin type-III domain-containing protein n=1 Tax=Acrobeloides nanus TaxID=290746 RepID=A0A914CFT2_9BILA
MILRKEWPLLAAISTAMGAMLLLLQVSTSVGQTLVDCPAIQPHLSADSNLLNDLQPQDVMRTLRRMKRSVPKKLPPEITLDPPGDTQVLPPHWDIRVKCTATGVPTPIVKWILEDGSQFGPVLQLNYLQTDTTATCYAENNVGKAQAVLQILIAGPGTPPNEIVVIPMLHQEINVKWTSPDMPNGRITEYIIYYGEVPAGAIEPTEWTTVLVPPDEVRHKLTDLKPKTNYAVKMQAISDRGPGVESEPTIVETFPLSPKASEAAEVVVHENNINSEDVDVQSVKINVNASNEGLPVVSKIVPQKGPISGGTNIRIEGENLDTGSEMNVKLGEVPCIITNLTTNYIVCQTKPAKSESFESLEIVSDGESFQFKHQFQFV